jgi:diguanylate cyclase (GGDEF)-like protein
MLLDLDGFKEVNDTLGHQSGDELLRMVASRLRQRLRESDTVARLGGDEFAVLPATVTDPDAVIFLAKKITATLKAPFVVADQKVTVRISIGIALFPDDGLDPGALMSRADAAMYAAKKAKLVMRSTPRSKLGIYGCQSPPRASRTPRPLTELARRGGDSRAGWQNRGMFDDLRDPRLRRPGHRQR